MPILRLFDLLPHILENFPKEDALAAKEKGQWKKYSTEYFVSTAENFALGLLESGYIKGDKVAIIANNRPEWNIADLAMQQIGIVDIPIYPTISDGDLAFILNDAEIKLVLVSGSDLFTKVKNVSPDIKILSFDILSHVEHWLSVVEIGKKSSKKAELEKIKASIAPEHLATLLYTSGTTGTPKGVMLSHNNLVSNFIACKPAVPADERHRALSFLPLNHIYERMLTYLYIYLGISIYYAEGIEKIGENIKEIKPEVFSAVPRLIEKVYDKIIAKGHDLKGIKKQLFFWAVELGKVYEPSGGNGFIYNLKLSIARKLIFSKWKEALGGNIRAIVSGGAALNPQLARIFWAAEMHVLEGYGLTETSPVIAVNNLNPNSLRIGTVGPIIEGVEVKIAEDGEILCKGPNVMMGYYKHPELSAEVIDKDGYFHTGDIGTFVENRFLKITDRKKEIFKTSGGKYIAPQMIENKLKSSPFIEQSMVIGEGEKFPSAFIVPAFSFIKDWAAKKGIEIGKSPKEIIENQEVKNKIKEEIEKINLDLAQYEKIKRSELLEKEFAVASGELTPKLSLRRKFILSLYSDVYKKIYDGQLEA